MSQEPAVPPRLFVIGDSISLHYGPYLESLVEGRFAYRRKGAEATRDAGGPPEQKVDVPREVGRGAGAPAVLDYPHGPFGENAGDSGMVLAYLSARPVAAVADVLLLNCGLHDLKVDRLTGRHQVAIERYEENLAASVAIVRDTGTRLVWCTTTPVEDDVHALRGRDLAFGRSAMDVTRYNAVATRVMQAARVPIIDLHAMTLALASDDGGGRAGLYVDHVHYQPWVRAAQAAHIAGWLSGRFA